MNMKKTIVALALVAMLIVPMMLSYESDSSGTPLTGYGEGNGITVAYEESSAGGSSVGTMRIVLSNPPKNTGFDVTIDQRYASIPKDKVINGNTLEIGSSNILLTEGVHNVSVSASSYNVSCSLVVSEPEETGVFYFFIKYDLPTAGTELLKDADLGILTEDELTGGYWIKAEANNAANALVAANEVLASSLSFDEFSSFYGWIDKFMGLGTITLSSNEYCYWNQYSWNSGWSFNDLCLGYIESKPTDQYIAMIFCESSMEGGYSGSMPTPSDIPATVRDGPAVEFEVSSISIDGGNLSLNVNQTVELYCKMNPSATSQKSVTWTVGDPNIVSINGRTVKALSSGSTTVTAYCGGKADSITVTVSNESSIPVQKLSINKTEASLETGSTLGLSVTVTPTNATDKTVKWSSSNSSVATVDSNGKVTAVSKGTATITATANGGSNVKATCTITVTEKTTEVRISTDSVSLSIGETYNLTATVTPSGQSIGWTSSNSSVATVDGNGKVTAKAAGNATITAKVSGGNASDTCSVTVSAKKVTDVTLSDTALSMTVGETHSLTATVSPSDATDRKVTWTSSNSSVATVDGNGKVTAKAAGNATITAKTADGPSASCAVTVDTKHVDGVSLSKTELNLTVGSSYTLTATVSPTDASDKRVRWSSSDTSIATVDSNGKVTGLKAGQVVITVTTVDGSKTASCSVTLSVKNVTGVTISKSETSISVNNTYTFTATVSPSDATDKSVIWSSSDTSVASVDGNGNVKGLKEGTATITVTTNDGKKTADVSVTVSVKKVQGISLNKSTLSLGAGNDFRLVATFSPADATDKSVTWESSYSSIAKVDGNGKVTGVKPGTAVITVTSVDGNKTATCTVNVVKAVASIVLNKTSLELNTGGSAKLTATVLPSDAEDKTVTWSSSDKSVATVDSNGNVKAVSVGNAAIKATSSDGSKTAECSVTVKDAGSSGKVVEESENSKTVATKSGNKWTSESVLNSDVTVRGGTVNVSISDQEIFDAVSQIQSVRVQTTDDMESVIKVSAGKSLCDSVAFSISSESLSALRAVSGLSLSFESAAANIGMSEGVVKTLSGMGKDATVSVSNTAADSKTEKSLSIKNGLSISIDIAGQGSAVHQLGGKATVSVQYTLPSGSDQSDVAVWYMDNGTSKKIDASYKSGIVTFETDHMSEWIVGTQIGSPGASTDSSTMLIVMVAAVIAVLCVAIALVAMKKRGSKSA